MSLRRDLTLHPLDHSDLVARTASKLISFLMASPSASRLLSGAVILGLCGFAVHLLRMHPTVPSASVGKPIAAPSPSAQPGLPEFQTLPDGRRRPLSLSLPSFDEIIGSRWEANFLIGYTLNGVELRGDVLYNSAGEILAVRRGREELETRSIPQNLYQLLARWVQWRVDRNPDHYQPPPLIKKVELMPMKLTDPEFVPLVQTVGFWFFEADYKGYHRHPKLVGALATAYQVQVWVDDRPPLNVVVSRSTEGLNTYSTDYSRYGDLPFAFIPSANKHGATIQYSFTALSAGGEVIRDGGLGWYLTEAWKGESPWPEESLDPIYGDNLLSELVLPHLYDALYSDGDFTNTVPKPADAYARRREQIMAAKAKRLEQEPHPPAGKLR